MDKGVVRYGCRVTTAALPAREVREKAEGGMWNAEWRGNRKLSEYPQQWAIGVRWFRGDLPGAAYFLKEIARLCD